MTDSYNQYNINQPRGSRTLAANVALNLDDDLVVIDSSGGPVTATLPDARTIPGRFIIIKAPNGGTNAVTVDTVGGQTIDGGAIVVMSTTNESLLVKSDGSNWQIANGGAGTVVFRDRTRHCNTNDAGADGGAADPWRVPFGTDANMGPPSMPATPTGPPGPCYEWLAESAGRLIGVEVVYSDAAVAPVGLVTASLLTLPPPIPQPGPGKPPQPGMGVVASASLAMTGDLPGFIVMPGTAIYSAGDLVAVELSGFNGLAPPPGAAFTIRATCIWEF